MIKCGFGIIYSFVVVKCVNMVIGVVVEKLLVIDWLQLLIQLLSFVYEFFFSIVEIGRYFYIVFDVDFFIMDFGDVIVIKEDGGEF